MSCAEYARIDLVLWLILKLYYSGLYFASTKMIDGTGHVWTTDIGSLEAMPNPTTASSLYSSGVGNRGNGYARITCLPYD